MRCPPRGEWSQSETIAPFQKEFVYFLLEKLGRGIVRIVYTTSNSMTYKRLLDGEGISFANGRKYSHLPLLSKKAGSFLYFSSKNQIMDAFEPARKNRLVSTKRYRILTLSRRPKPGEPIWK